MKRGQGNDLDQPREVTNCVFAGMSRCCSFVLARVKALTVIKPNDIEEQPSGSQ